MSPPAGLRTYSNARQPPINLQMVITLVLTALIALVHEAGHAIARAVCARRAFTPAGHRMARLDAMVTAVDLDGPWRPDTFSRLIEARTTAADAIRIALAGPTLSLAAGIVAVFSREEIAIVGGLSSIIYGLASLVPLRVAGSASDGRRALDAAAALKRLTA